MKEKIEKVAERWFKKIKSISFKKAVEFDEKWNTEIMINLMNEYADDVMGGCNLRAKEWYEKFKKKKP
jgi:hypothetical protein